MHRLSPTYVNMHGKFADGIFMEFGIRIPAYINYFHTHYSIRHVSITDGQYRAQHTLPIPFDYI